MANDTDNKPATETETVKRGRKPTPAGETKAAAFIRIGVGRVSNILDAVDSLGNLSGSGYEYTPAQVEKIFAAIDASLSACKGRFTGDKAAASGFSL